MIGIIIVGSEGLPTAFKESVEHLYGDQPQFEAVSIPFDEEIERSRKRVFEAITRVDSGDGVAIFTEMFGGVPSNLSISAMSRPDVEVLAGLNLPMILKLVEVREKFSLSEAAAAAQEAGRKYQAIASKVLKSDRLVSRSKEHTAPTKVPANFIQRPAAFRFGLRDGKIDALPETLETLDTTAAKDLRQEVLTKAKAFLERLRQSNSSQRVQLSTVRLIDSLGKAFDSIRPGVLLSRSRSLEADRNAFDSEEGSKELFPDAIALIDDLLLSLHDLLSIFPIVREIEAERLALAIGADHEAINGILIHADTLKYEASHSRAVSDLAAQSLSDNDAEINRAESSLLRSRLVADQLLVIRNFVSAVARVVSDYQSQTAQALKPTVTRIKSEIGQVSSDSWDEIRTNFPRGMGAASRVVPIILLIALLGQMSLPLAGLAAIAGFKPLIKAIAKLTANDRKKKTRK